jgi:spermidine/putrescine transport system ATP-binding protein
MEDAVDGTEHMTGDASAEGETAAVATAVSGQGGGQAADAQNGQDTSMREAQDGHVDVRLARVTKRFGDMTAVNDLTLGIGRGEFFSLLGPSGCGKTTTLRMIGGFEEPSTGVIYLDDRDVTGLPPYKRDVNTVFQSYALFPHLTVSENVAFGLQRRGVGKAEAEQRVKEALQLVDLPGFGKRKPSQLSGGQQQRVALARALVNRPKVLLLDEPLGALDLKLRKQMQLELKRIQSEVGITFIYVTHDQEEAMTMSDHLAVMRHGRIEQIGSPEQVYERPATEFVAGFLGASNLLDGHVVEKDGSVTKLRLDDGTLVSLPTPSSMVDDRALRIGVRPEKIRLQQPSDATPDGWNAVKGTARFSTFVGVSHQYTVDVFGSRTMTVYTQNLGNEWVPRPGDEAVLVWQPQHTFAVTPSEPLASWEEDL